MSVTCHALNLRHLRVALEVSKAGGISQASGNVHMSQPAMTHAIKTLENQVNTRLFDRGARGVSVTSTGRRFTFRIERALGRLNARLPRTNHGKNVGYVERRASTAQLKTLIAVADTASFSAAARLIGCAQPTVYRAARELEACLELDLFEKSENAVHLTRAGQRLAQNARLAFAEIEQALLEVAESLSEGTGQVRVGALPLARATFLSHTINRAITARPALQVHVDDGPYPDLLLALRNGALDLLVGALRDPPPTRDVVQTPLFEDRLGVFCGPGHPLLGRGALTRADLRGFPWVVPRLGTPTRGYFEATFRDLLSDTQRALVETSSMILVRELLQSRNRLTLISKAQVATEVRQGTLFEIPVGLPDAPRPIGYTCRRDWYPTKAQQLFVETLKSASHELP